MLLPKPWIKWSSLTWISRCRRLARDYDRTPPKASAYARLAMIRLMLRRGASQPMLQIAPTGSPPLHREHTAIGPRERRRNSLGQHTREGKPYRS
jgi:hypothetical protein